MVSAMVAAHWLQVFCEFFSDLAARLASRRPPAAMID
jgi:hypothetical protein